MPDFTIRLRDALKYLGAEAKIVNGEMVVTGDIGLSHYPIFDESYRSRLNGKIVRHYWNEEIGVETIDLWKFNMETDMAENMPYFNQLYESERLTFDPLKTIDVKTMTHMTRDQDTQTDSSGMTEQGSDSFSHAVQSQLPQTMLSKNKDYATSGAQTTSESTSSGTSSETINANVGETGDSTSETSGFQMLGSDMLLRFRETFLNLDVTVIESLSQNFMLIKNSGSRYSDIFTPGRYTI